ncbi:MAG TPA: hypothetical protein VLG67_00610, partial [Candidatus Saccharimonadales bacterium]|nr:hypothetical protein [Candidatus Saccharimonadales bacterium]
MPDIFINPDENQTQPAKPEKTNKPVENPALSNLQTAQSEQQNPIGLFTTFLKNPSGVSFSEQDQDEKIVLFLRRDFGSNTPWIAATIFLIIIPSLLSFILHSTGVTVPFLPSNFIRMSKIFYYFVVAGFAFSNYLTWFFTLGLVTDKRAVDIDFINVSSIQFASANLSDIIDAKYSQNGFSQSFFDYGDVSIAIQTPQDKLIFEKSPRPAEVSNIIDDL